VPQRHLIAIGPIIAPDADSACALIADVATGHRGDIVTDVPSSQTEFVARLETAGFSAGAEAPVMIYDGDELPGDRARLFAIPNRGFC
jgi:hypothetical protein